MQGSQECKCPFHKASNLCERVLEDAKQQYAASVADSIATQQLGSRDFWRISNSVLNRRGVGLMVKVAGLRSSVLSSSPSGR